jgi:hypothetical protein
MGIRRWRINYESAIGKGELVTEALVSVSWSLHQHQRANLNFEILIVDKVKRAIEIK